MRVVLLFVLHSGEERHYIFTLDIIHKHSF